VSATFSAVVPEATEMEMVQSTFPNPKDRLPDMVEFATMLVAVKSANNNAPFMRRGGKERELRNMELDHGAIRQIFMHMVRGGSAQDRFGRSFQNFMHKPQLIRTINAVKMYRERSLSLGNNICQLMQEERVTYFRQCAFQTSGSEDSDNVFNSVSFKLTQMLFILSYISNDTFQCKPFVKKPDPYFKGRLTLFKNEPLRECFKDYFTPGENLDADPDAVLPFHPDWFAHDIPLFETPLYGNLVAAMYKQVYINPNAYESKMCFFRSLLAETVGSMETELDLVTTAQTKLLGMVVAAFMFLLQHHFFF